MSDINFRMSLLTWAGTAGGGDILTVGGAGVRGGPGALRGIDVGGGAGGIRGVGLTVTGCGGVALGNLAPQYMQ
ncbi:MAG: hypothetical protein NWE76_02755 [Candidatus Bathyarchaeota archaeon]|nr:hypothetical protein [Candidatus Bathyarchaeota archaeon]